MLFKKYKKMQQIEDNIKVDDSVSNYTRVIMNSGTGNVIYTDDPKYKAPPISSAIKITKVGVALNLMLLLSLFLNIM